MKINWTVRMKNGVFWTGAISLLLSLLYMVLNMLKIVPEFDQKQIMDIVMIILQILAFVGVISDPTTKGIGDSNQALTYTEPKTDNPENK